MRYLVNCGNKIDKKLSIFGEAPIHKAVLSSQQEKQQTLGTIIENCNADVNNLDANGWSPLHHAANVGDAEAASILLGAGASVSSYSN